MTASLIIAALLFAGCALGAQAQELSAEQLESNARRLVRQLDDDLAGRREQAREKLLELGPPGLKWLPLPHPTKYSAEVNKHLREIRNILQRRDAESSSEESTVTLSTKAKLSELLAQIEKQTGNKLTDVREQFGQQPTDPEIEVSFDKTPFWEAIDDVLDKAGMSVYPYVEDSTLGLQNRPPGTAKLAGRIGRAGPFRFEPSLFQINRDLRKTEGGDCRLQLEVTWEPRLTPIVIHFDPSTFDVVDEQNNQLALQERGGLQEVPIVKGEVATELVVPLQVPSRTSQSISRFKGQVTAVIPGKPETFTFRNLTSTKKPSATRGGVTVSLTRVFKNNEIWDLNVVVQFDKTSGALESHRGWVLD
ncbi:MAG: hypothetical protein N2C14_04030, partial [Planctomycetales bacterium]